MIAVLPIKTKCIVPQRILLSQVPFYGVFGAATSLIGSEMLGFHVNEWASIITASAAIIVACGNFAVKWGQMQKSSAEAEAIRNGWITDEVERLKEFECHNAPGCDSRSTYHQKNVTDYKNATAQKINS